MLNERISTVRIKGKDLIRNHHLLLSIKADRKLAVHSVEIEEFFYRLLDFT